jgi:agmatinase
MKTQSEKAHMPREGIFRGQDSGADGTCIEMPYSGIRSFMRRRPSRDLAGVDMAVYGIPFDLTTSGRPGARLGPSAIREASTQLAWGEVWPWGFDPFDVLSVVDYGDVSFRRGQVDKMIDNAIDTASTICASGAQTIMMGGDHCTTYTALKAQAAVHGPLCLIHFDAHRDNAPSRYFDHGTFVHHAIEEGLIDEEHSVQIGIRTFYDTQDSMQVLYRDWLHEHGWRGALAKIKEVVGDRKAYLSIDVDVFDPAFAPGTGTPVVDGLAPHDVIAIIRDSLDINFVGMDLVEVSPPYDNAEVTSLLGASLILEYICSRAALKLQENE